MGTVLRPVYDNNTTIDSFPDGTFTVQTEL